jgi:ferrochelatase
MSKRKTGVLLINLGTPDSPSTYDVRRYLTEFLNDPRVIDISWLPRKMLVNLIIVPFRAPKSAKIYRELWEHGNGESPLLTYSNSVQQKVQHAFGDELTVELAMRYGKPSMDDVLERMRKANYDRIIILPLYPQYASASTGSSIDKALKIIRKWWVIPELKIISQFYDHEGYIDAFVENGRKYNIEEYDHVLFSYHGLPERQVDKTYVDEKPCSDHNCEHELNETNSFCYKATSYATTRAIVAKLGIPEEKYTVCFQSRLNDKWLKPYSDKMVEELAKKGAKKILVFSPAFVADCLETIVEIGGEYQEIFEANGGEKVQLVESLNDQQSWVDAIQSLISEQL